MAFQDFKNLPRRTTAHKILHDKAFKIAKNTKHDRYQCRLFSMVYTFFNKKPSDRAVEIAPNKELAKELHKPIIKKFEKQKPHSSF